MSYIRKDTSTGSRVNGQKFNSVSLKGAGNKQKEREYWRRRSLEQKKKDVEKEMLLETNILKRYGKTVS